MFGLDDDPECRAIVLCSEGKHFCAGADLGPESDLVDQTANLYTQAVRLFSARKPIVAAVQGAAIGGGLGLALAADFRVATPETRFSCNFARLGFHQGFGISVTLPAVVGQQRALELLYTGGQVKGAEALAIGLADRLTSPDDLRAAAVALGRGDRERGPALGARDSRDHARRSGHEGAGGDEARARGAAASAQDRRLPRGRGRDRRATRATLHRDVSIRARERAR